MLNAPALTTGTTGRVWIHSDLQLSKPELARQVLTAAIDDLLELDLGIGAAWCLGDAVSGNDEPALEEVADTTFEQLDRLSVPVCYVMGNHEMDTKRTGIDRYPLYERARKHPQWHTTEAISDFYFARTCFGIPVIFMGDHAASDGQWWVSHGMVMEGEELYPHTPDKYHALRDAIAAHDGPVLTAGHQSYPGSEQRPSSLSASLLPLPENVRAHFYGHAHIGDVKLNKVHPYRRENPIDGMALRQFNISALETKRSGGSHSAILEFGPTGPTQLRIRCHLERKWMQTFDLTRTSVSA